MVGAISVVSTGVDFRAVRKPGPVTISSERVAILVVASVSGSCPSPGVDDAVLDDPDQVGHARVTLGTPKKLARTAPPAARMR